MEGFKDRRLIDNPASMPFTVRPLEVAVASTSSPTLSGSSAFKIENKSVHAVFLTTVFILKHTHTQQTHDFVALKKLLILCPLMLEYKALCEY